MAHIEERLFELADAEYKRFHSSLMPTVDPQSIIGVRVPQLRKLASEIRGTEEAAEFLIELPHRYYEENNLHAFLIAGEADFDTALSETEKFLPFIDNWATCDSLSSKAFSKNPDRLEAAAFRWLTSEKTYVRRYGIVTLMRNFLGEGFTPDHLERVREAVNEEYYVKMAAAWYYATALALRYDDAIMMLTLGKLDRYTHNKTIQKAVESFRVTEEHKKYLKTLRRR